MLNVVSRYKDRKQNRPVLLIGDAIDAESGARAQARTPWEGDVLLNFDALVSHILFGMLKDLCSGRYALEANKFLFPLGFTLSALVDWSVTVK